MSNSEMRNPSSTSSHAEGGRSWCFSPVIPVLAATLGCLPLLSVHFQQLWSRPHYQYFPLVLVSVVVLYQLRRTDPDRTLIRPRPWLACLALLGGLGLATYAVLQISPLLCCAAWLLTAIALVARTTANTWSQWALLCLLLRLPLGGDVALIQWLQKVTTRVSSGVLDQLRIFHFRSGNVLVFPNRKLFVEEACSGAVSLFTILATAAILGAFLRRTAFHTVLLMLSGAFWAGAANILRVVAIAYFVEKMGIDLTEGWPHDLLGLAIFVVTVITLFCTDALLRFLFGPIEIDEYSTPEPIHGNPLVRFWNWLFWPDHDRPVEILASRPLVSPLSPGGGWLCLVLVTSAGFFSLGALQVWGGIGPFTVGLRMDPDIDSLSKESLPLELAGWTLTEFRRENRSASSEFGERSRQWTYTQGTQTATVSVDYPFPGFHELDVCYRGIGWTTGPQTSFPDESTARQYSLRNDHESGWLIFDLFDQHGAPYQPPSGSGIHPRWRRLLSGDSSRWTLPTYYQVQLLAIRPSLQPLDAQSTAELQQLFSAFREQVRERTKPFPSGDQP